MGDPGTIDTRVNAWLAAMAIGVIAVALAWRVHGWLAEHGRSTPLRQLSAAAIVLVALASLFALPDNPDAVTAGHGGRPRSWTTQRTIRVPAMFGWKVQTKAY